MNIAEEQFTCPYLCDPQLQSMQGLSHGFFTKQGGVSTDTYASLNCGIYTEDDPQAIQHNLARVSHVMSAGKLKPLLLKQVHSNEVKILESKSDFQHHMEADALVTNQKNLLLGVLTADCVPVLFCDPEAEIIAACHAGWRGAYSGVLQNTVSAMMSLGSEAENIYASIGPCISASAYEVGQEFVDQFLEKDQQSEMFFEKKDEKIYFDIRSFVEAELKKELQNISHVRGQPNQFFSHRQDPKSGRQVSVIGFF